MNESRRYFQELIVVSLVTLLLGIFGMRTVLAESHHNPPSKAARESVPGGPSLRGER